MRGRLLFCFFSSAAMGIVDVERSTSVSRSFAVDTVRLQERTSAPRINRLARPHYSIGGLKDDEAEEFDHKNGFLKAILLRNGSVLALDRAKLRLFDERGKQVRVIGTKGQGPGEFIYLTDACQTRGDTIIVHDSNNYRISVLTSKGDIVRQFPSGGKMLHSYCFDDGTFMIKKGGPREQAQPRANLVRVSTAGVIVQQMGSFPDEQFLDGLEVPVSYVASGSTLYVADGRGREIRAYDNGGKLQRVFQMHEPLESLSKYGGKNVKRSIPVGPMSRPSELPKTAPTLRDIFADGKGNLWVQDYRFNYEPGFWTIYNLTTGKARRLTYPSEWVYGPDILGVNGDNILYRRRDNDGAAYFEIAQLNMQP